MFGQSSQNANKSVCQFYQRGNCKYGNNCFNLHPGASAGASTSNVFGRSNSTSGLGFNSNNALQDTQFVEFVKQIIAEMKMWETNGLWQLSCLAPLKDHPPITEFVDTSPEELRVVGYESFKSGNLSAYQTSFNSKFEYQKQLRQSLKNRLPEALEVLKNVYYKTDSNGSTSNSSSTNLFGKPSGSFAGNSTSQSSIFGGTNGGNKAPSMFGGAPNLGANNIFGAKPPASTFGGGSVFGSSALGGTNTFKSTFGNNQSTLFGGSANKEPSQNIFGTNQNQGFGGTSTGSTNIFGTSTNTSGSSSFFGTNTNTSNSNSIFGSNTSTTNSNPLFGTNTNTSSSNSLFGTSSATGTNNLFGANASSTGSNSLFGSNANNNGTNSLFGNNTNTSVSNNLFGTNTNTNGSVNIFGSNPNANGNNNQFGTNANTSGSNNFFGSNPSSGSTSMFDTNTHTTGSNNVFGTTITNNNNVPNQNSSNAFGDGGSQQEFGTVPAFGSQNIFNNNNNQGSANVFGGGTNQNTQSFPFGIASDTKDNQGNVFGGGSMASKNVFGGENVDQVANHGETSGNNFGTNEQNQVGTTAATTATSSSIFGGNLENKPNMFGASTTNSVFSANIGQNAVSKNNIFSGSTNSNNPNSSSIFGKPPEPADAVKPQTNTNLFPSNTQNVSASENINDQIYTPMHLLTIDDKNEFERDTFLRIPLIPPPKELCF